MTDDIEYNPSLWDALEELISNNTYSIQQKRGSHTQDQPDLVFPFDYGHLTDKSISESADVKIWLGSKNEYSVDALILKADLKKQETAIELLIGCTRADCLEIDQFHTSNSIHSLLIERGDLQTWLRSRISVRQFSEQPVPRNTLYQIIETATWAPSAHNRQPWRFVILESKDSREKLTKSMGENFRADLLMDGISKEEAGRKVSHSASQIMCAPCLILLCLDSACGDQYPDERRRHSEYLTGVQSTALAGGALLLAAHAAGLAGFWMCAPLFASDSVCSSLELPDPWHPQALILLGYPQGEAKPRSRHTLDKVVLSL